MSAYNKFGESNSAPAEDVIIPISEWPISEGEASESIHVRQSTKRILSNPERDDENLEKRHKQHNLYECQSMRKPPHAEDAPKQTTITAKIAKWWRQRGSQGINQNVVKCGPKSMIYHISRLPECRSFLQRERKRLLMMLEVSNEKADVYAALASLEDYMTDFSTALNYIDKALKIESDSAEHLWLREKLFRQCRVLEEQNTAKMNIDEKQMKFPSMNEVPRISGKTLSVANFQKNFLRASKPVIITDIVSDMTKVPFGYTLVIEHAGKTTVTTKEALPDSLTWAKLENKRDTTMAELIQGVQDGSVKDVLFDWSLPIHCPNLAEQISLPEYFKDNFLLQTSPGSLYRESWPSLFIAPKGATTQLHIDAFHSHFWMALFEGEKRWTFFDQKDTAFLYPKWFQSLDPVFEMDLTKPDLQHFPLFALTHPQQCVLKKGDLLFVPAGSPHFVENLTATLAISSNYVDHSNYDQVCKELKINAFQDQRADDLLSQLQDSAFLSKVEIESQDYKNESKPVEDNL